MSDANTIKLLESAVRRREPLKLVTDAFRLVNGGGDGLEGLVIEQYGRHFSAQVFDKRWLAEKELLTGFLRDQLNAGYFIVKDRTGPVSSSPEDFKKQIWLKGGSSVTVVRENGLNFSVDLDDTLNSGLFLDMRGNREIVAGSAKGRRVLNCFAYTCSFGVYCRARGALGVVNVDVSKKNLERGRLNYRLNGLEPARNELIRADAFEYLKRAQEKRNSFGLIILDPPSFSRYEGRVFSVKKDMPGLVALAIKALEPGGDLFVSTNFSGMNSDGLLAMVKAGAGKRKIRRRDSLGQDIDFTASGSMPQSCLAALLVSL